MSAMIHGEKPAMDLAWESTDVLLRILAQVTLNSTRAWSTAVNTWVGSELLGPFFNLKDEQSIIKSMPPELLAEFQTELQ